MFIFVDIETGGLPTWRPVGEIPILEVGVIVTDTDLNERLARSWVVHHPEEVLSDMSPWCVKVHGESGLTEASLASDHTLVEVERQLVETFKPVMLPDGFPERPGKDATYGIYPMCGSSIHFDRQFIQQQMPAFNELFHYRNLDVSTLRNLFDAWGQPTAPRTKKEPDHRVLADIRFTIQALRFYRDEYITLPAGG